MDSLFGNQLGECMHFCLVQKNVHKCKMRKTGVTECNQYITIWFFNKEGWSVRGDTSLFGFLLYQAHLLGARLLATARVEPWFVRMGNSAYGKFFWTMKVFILTRFLFFASVFYRQLAHYNVLTLFSAYIWIMVFITCKSIFIKNIHSTLKRKRVI